MEIQKPDLPEQLTFAGIEIPVNQQSTLVMALLALLHKQAAEIQELRDEILRLKKTTTKPIIKPSRLLKPTPSEDGANKWVRANK